jgi:UDP-N-acetylglucosamine/UDP-N-acetylgalactosamine diphosphorylase
MSSRSQSGSIESRYEHAAEELASRGQSHVLRWWDDLDTTQRERLLGQIEPIPWEHVEPLIESHVRHRPADVVPENLEPPPVYPRRPDASQAALYRDAQALGGEMIRAGRVAAFTVAGGQGTRLGFDGPKGALSVSPVRGKSLFQLFAEMILAARRRYGCYLRWYIMTSQANRDQTIAYLKEHAYFGLDPDDVMLFVQGMLPCFDFEGRLLLEDKARIAMAPDGHGGSLKAMVAGGALDDMRSHGIQIISYFQVDNPLVKPFDPLFIGLHGKTEAEMSAKVTPKADDIERVGNVCTQDGHVAVVEYSNLPEELARSRNPDGTRRFNSGNLAIHLIDVAFVDRIIARRFDLPYHRAEKAVTCLDERGAVHTPPRPNAVKLETFVFDALPLAANPVILEVERAEEFSPVKNATGVDSVETAVRDQIDRAARWLEAAGAAVPRKPNGEPDVVLEIAPSFAEDADEIPKRMTEPPVLKPSDTIYLD